MLATQRDKELSARDYERMARELESMAETVRAQPEINHHFADRLLLLAKEMRANATRIAPTRP
jgi:hypothetical protein